MASGIFSSERNLSLYTVPAAYILAILPYAFAITSYGKFDNRNPRSLTKDIENDQSIDKATKDRLFRLNSASANGLENVGIFAAGVVAGNVAGLSNEVLNRLSLGYILSRGIYNVLYARNITPARAHVRSLVFWIGAGLIGSLFVRSGYALNSKVLV